MIRNFWGYSVVLNLRSAVSRSRDLLGVPFLELAKRSGMADEDATEDIDVKPLFAQLQQDWFAIENVRLF